MAKINVTLAAREITEHFAAGEHSRAFQRRELKRLLPAYVASLGLAVPRYGDRGQPLTVAAYKATAERTARLAARAAAATAAREASMAARIATAAALSATYTGDYDGDYRDGAFAGI